MSWISGPMSDPSHDHTVYGDDEYAESQERQREAAGALAATFVANADAHDDEANSALIAEILRRMRERDA